MVYEGKIGVPDTDNIELNDPEPLTKTEVIRKYK